MERLWAGLVRAIICIMSGAVIWVIDPISYTGLAYYDASLVTALRAEGIPVLLVGSDCWLLRERTDVSVPQVPLFRGSASGSRWRRGLGYMASMLRLLRATARFRPAVAHWQYTQFLLVDVIGMTAMKLLGTKVVYTAHEIVPWRAQDRRARLLVRLLYTRVADRVIVHNEQDAIALARQSGLKSTYIRVINHGDYALFAEPGLDQETARARLGLPQAVPVALFFGTLRPSKGVDILLRAWPLVLERVPTAHLVVAGQPDRSLGAEVQTLLTSTTEDLRSSVTARLSRIADSDVNAYYRAADVVVLPYHAITTSGVLRYAYSSARPVVATAVGEHPTWVVPGVTGYLVPREDPQALAGALVALLRDRTLCARLGEAALRFAKEHFDWTTIARKTAALYAELAPGLPGERLDS